MGIGYVLFLFRRAESRRDRVRVQSHNIWEIIRDRYSDSLSNHESQKLPSLG